MNIAGIFNASSLTLWDSVNSALKNNVTRSSETNSYLKNDLVAFSKESLLANAVDKIQPAEKDVSQTTDEQLKGMLKDMQEKHGALPAELGDIEDIDALTSEQLANIRTELAAKSMQPQPQSIDFAAMSNDELKTFLTNELDKNNQLSNALGITAKEADSLSDDELTKIKDTLATAQAAKPAEPSLKSPLNTQTKVSADSVSATASNAGASNINSSGAAATEEEEESSLSLEESKYDLDGDGKLSAFEKVLMKAEQAKAGNSENDKNNNVINFNQIQRAYSGWNEMTNSFVGLVNYSA